MLPIKLSYNQEVRRIQVSSAVQDSQISYSVLVSAAYSLFPVLTNKTLTFLWCDDENDIVYCSTDEEIQEAVRIMSASKRSTFKFDVLLAPNRTNMEAPCGPIHRRVKCDGCGLKPIVGHRFKCTVREDFDLCEHCERSSVQPFPMIKVYNPKQSPELIVVAIREKADSHHSPPRGLKCCPRNHPLQRCNSQPADYCGAVVCDKCSMRIVCEDGFSHCGACQFDLCANCSNSKLCVMGRHGHGRRWKKMGKEEVQGADGIRNPKACFARADEAEARIVLDRLKACGHPCAEVVEAFIQAVSPPEVSCSAVPSPCSPVVSEPVAESEIIDQQIVEAVSKESLEFPDQAVSVASMSSSLSTSQLLSSAPSMRFVADITFPDSAVVQACSTLTKVWRIKNDGNVAWPTGTFLSACGGDNLSGEKKEFVLVPTTVLPDEELDVAVALTAPGSCGRYVAYYKLTTPEGKYFGQRLWADINVEEEEEGEWDVVSPSDHDSHASVQTAVADTGEAAVEEPVIQYSSAPAETVEAVNSFQEDIVVEDIDDDSNDGAEQPADYEDSKWARELFALREMGFDDVSVLVPLLAEHLPDPTVLTEAVRTERLQIVIITLLGQSGALNA
jgi:hypothetical protein